MPVDLAAWCHYESVQGVGTPSKTASKAVVFCRLPIDLLDKFVVLCGGSGNIPTVFYDSNDQVHSFISVST